MKYPVLIMLIVLSAILLCGCTKQNTQQIYTNQSIVDEILRLNSLNSKGVLTPENFSRLETMLANNDHALDEIKEIKVLSKYKEYYHVFHGISFLLDYINTSIPEICPGHSLAHYYIFTRHNETILAANNLKEAKDKLSIWIPLAESYNQKNSVVEDFNATVERIRKDISNIDSGNISASDDEIDWLSTDGSICVQNTNN